MVHAHTHAQFLCALDLDHRSVSEYDAWLTRVARAARLKKWYGHGRTGRTGAYGHAWSVLLVHDRDFEGGGGVDFGCCYSRAIRFALGRVSFKRLVDLAV